MRPASGRPRNDIDGPEEIHHERIRGQLDDLVDRAVLFDDAVVDDDDAVGQLDRLLLIVRHENAGQMNLVVEPPQPSAEIAADVGVERTERLVEEQDLRFDGERAGQRDALPLSA